MIGMRAALPGLLAAAVALGAVGPGGPDPSARLAADRHVLERARAAETALVALEEGIGPALDAARRGAARIVAGDQAPGSELRAAADGLVAAEPFGRRASSALAALNSARRARTPGSEAIAAPVDPGELASIGAQLESTAAAGEAFTAMRMRAAAVTAAIDRSLTALEAGDLPDARRGVDEARDAFTAVDAWETDLATLPLWLDTTDAMIGAVETIVEATATGDAERAAEAAARFAALSDEGVVADRALRIAVSEGGSAVAAPALGRLAGVLNAVREARTEVAMILQAADR